MAVAETLRRLGGIASTGQLLANGMTRDWIRMAVDYGRIVRVSKGWFAGLDVPAAAIEARAVGGRLACVSALQFHGVPVQEDEALHIAVAGNASRLRRGRSREVVVHWCRREAAGDAVAVSVEEAWAQWARCRKRT